jgi:hypothetical protein
MWSTCLNQVVVIGSSEFGSRGQNLEGETLSAIIQSRDFEKYMMISLQRVA